MCGILLFQSKKINNLQKNLFHESLKKLEKRGPDKTSFYSLNNTLIGFTRLSINNIKTGSQPFESLCGKYIIVFNGEIVNYKILSDQLISTGINIRHGHECEVIINLYILYGKKCLDYLRGFFAFVIIEKKNANIFAAVDRFSIKPLYYLENIYKDFFIITSDYSCVLNSSIVDKNVNYNKIVEYFAFARDFDNSAFYKNIKLVNAGSYLIKEKKDTRHPNIIIRNYWRPFQEECAENLIESYKNLLSEFEIKLKEVINLWKISDVPISLCLSTGVDSIMLNYLMKISNTDFTSFNIPEDKKFYQKKINKFISYSLNLNDVISSLNTFTKNNKSPSALAHSSSAVLIAFYEFIQKNGFKVAINGEGSDELAGGYIRHFKQLDLMNNHKFSFEDSLLEVNRSLIDTFNLYKNQKLENIENGLKKKILSIKLTSRKNENKILEFDQLTWIPYLMKRHDRIGMNCGLEIRPPFLDHKLVEFMNILPIKYKFNSLNNKILLKKFLQYKRINFNKLKKGTPTLQSLILKNKKEMTSFKEGLFYGKLYNFFNVNKILIDLSKNNINGLFVWRLFILNKIFNS